MTPDVKSHHGNTLNSSLIGDHIEEKSKRRNSQIREMTLHELIILNFEQPFTPPLPYNFLSSFIPQFELSSIWQFLCVDVSSIWTITHLIIKDDYSVSFLHIIVPFLIYN